MALIEKVLNGYRYTVEYAYSLDYLAEIPTMKCKMKDGKFSYLVSQYKMHDLDNNFECLVNVENYVASSSEEAFDLYKKEFGFDLIKDKLSYYDIKKSYRRFSYELKISLDVIDNLFNNNINRNLYYQVKDIITKQINYINKAEKELDKE